MNKAACEIYGFYLMIVCTTKSCCVSLALVVFGLTPPTGFQETVIIVKGSGHWPFGSLITQNVNFQHTHIYIYTYLNTFKCMKYTA